MIALHCDREDCDTWQREPAATFLTLSGQNSTDHHFCSLDCVTHFAATYGPKETITM